MKNVKICAKNRRGFLLKTVRLGEHSLSEKGPCFVIAEIGHNHQGELSKALEMIRVAAKCGVHAVKFQKRNNRLLYTRAMYNQPYENENSYGKTYGEHREKLEFDRKDYTMLKKCAEANGVEFMCAPFDFHSVDFLEDLGITSYKFASGDITNLPLLTYAARFKKPIFLSTGAATMDEIACAYEAIRKYNDKICLMHCICEYPAEYEHLNLKVIQRLKKEFPEALIGYSSHDNGILAPVVAYMLGAVVLEKHFTLNRALKGSDHRFSLEPEGLRKQVRDLKRVDWMLGGEEKIVHDYEKPVRAKMGKSLYAGRPLKAGRVLRQEDIVIKTPNGGLEPYWLGQVLGRVLKTDLPQETLIQWNQLETDSGKGKKTLEKNKCKKTAGACV